MAEKTTSEYSPDIGIDNQKLFKGLQGAGDAVAAFVTNTKEALVNFGKESGVGNMIDGFANLGKEIESLSKATGVAAVFKNIKDISSTISGFAPKTLKGNGEGKSEGSSIMEKISGVVSSLKDGVKGLVAGAVSGASSFIGNFKDIGSKVFSGVASIFKGEKGGGEKGEGSGIMEKIGGVVSSLKDGVKGLVAGAVSGVSSFIGNFKDIGSKVFDGIKEMGTNAFGKVSSFLKGGEEGSASPVGELLGNTVDAIGEQFGVIVDDLKGIGGKAMSGDFNGAFSDVTNLFENTIKPAASGIGSGFLSGLTSLIFSEAKNKEDKTILEPRNPIDEKSAAETAINSAGSSNNSANITQNINTNVYSNTPVDKGTISEGVTSGADNLNQGIDGLLPATMFSGKV